MLFSIPALVSLCVFSVLSAIPYANYKEVIPAQCTIEYGRVYDKPTPIVNFSHSMVSNSEFTSKEIMPERIIFDNVINNMTCVKSFSGSGVRRGMLFRSSIPSAPYQEIYLHGKVECYTNSRCELLLPWDSESRLAFGIFIASIFGRILYILLTPGKIKARRIRRSIKIH